MLPALCPHPLPHNNLSKPTLSMDTGCSKDTVFNLHPHTQPLISKPHLCSRESWPGGVFTSATHRSYPQPRCLRSSCSFQHLGLTWAARHSYSGILGRDSVGTPCRTSGLYRRFSALSTSSCYLFPSSFLVPCYFFCFYQCHIWFYSSISPHSSSISIFLMSVVCLLFYLSTLISFMFL